MERLLRKIEKKNMEAEKETCSFCEGVGMIKATIECPRCAGFGYYLKVNCDERKKNNHDKRRKSR